MQKVKTHETNICELVTDEQINAFLLSFPDLQVREEALVLTEWLLTNDVQRFIAGDDALIKRGQNPPDFLISDDSRIAVEVSNCVTERKKILDNAETFPGLYTSTLRLGKADAAFLTTPMCFPMLRTSSIWTTTTTQRCNES